MGTSGMRIVTRKYLFDLMNNENLPNIEARLNFLKDQFMSIKGFSDNQIETLKSNFAHFKSEFKNRWTKAHYKEAVFLKSNESWLNGTFAIPVVADSPSNRTGRPSKSFGDLSERSKRRKTEEMRSNFDQNLIVHAAQVELRKSGKRDASNVLKEIITSPTRATKYKKAYYRTKSSKDKICPLSVQEAMQMFIDADLTRDQYETIRRTNKKFFPCYSLLQKEKKKCYPPPESCTVNSTGAEAELQPLVDLTVRRLSDYLEEVLTTLKVQECETLKLICKWGCDGSQQSQFKQKIENDTDSDTNIFQSCFVPVKLVCGQNMEKTIWENPTPSSPRFCRPIRFKFIKETTDVTEQEINHVNNQINSLVATEFDLSGKHYSVKHEFIMTMVDGKVCNAATGTTSTSRCYICGTTSKDFNNLDKTIDVNFEAIQFGLSVLHARIRIFESILPLAYKLPVKNIEQEKEKLKKASRKRENKRSRTGFAKKRDC